MNNREIKSGIGVIKPICLAIITALSMNNYAYAAEVEDEELDEPERIEITGSRIKKTMGEAVTPVVTVSGDEIRALGVLNLADALSIMPQVIPGASDANSNYNGSAGMSSTNLRGLGANRTLVLVNGRRHVASFPGSSAVDTSSIPVALIERIEIMTGGASAIYGADAVAGVLNIILKKSYEGTTLNAFTGISNEGDGFRKGFDLTHGRDVFEGSGNIVFNLSYSSSDEIHANKRDSVYQDIGWATNPADPDGVIEGVPNNVITERTRPWNNVDRNFFMNGVPHYIDSNGQTVEVDLEGHELNNSDEDFYTASVDADLAYYHGDYEYQLLRVPTERSNVNLTYQQELDDNTNLFVDVKFAHSSSQSYGGYRGEYGGTNLPLDYQYYTQDQVDYIADNGLVQGLTWAGRFTELERGKTDWENSLGQIVVGLDGEIGDYYWNAYLQHGVSESKITYRNSTDRAKYNSATYQSQEDGGEWQWLGEWVWQAPYTCDVDPECVAWDVFGDLTQEMVDYVTLDPHTARNKLKQTVLSLGIDGDILELPAGALAFAAGIEYRQEESFSTPSDVQLSGITGSKTTPIEGKYDVTEAYFETRVPLLSDVFLAKSLSVEGAIRYADYSHAGGNTSWNLGLDWMPIDDVKFRASYAKAARAPNITEVYADSNYSGQWFWDPCDVWYQGDDSPEGDAYHYLQPNCINQGVDLTNNDWGWTWIDVNFSGNKELKPEIAHTLTVGLVISPSFIDNLDITLDYWDIKLEDEISSLSMGTAEDTCFWNNREDYNSFCEFFIRNEETAQMEEVILSQLNLAQRNLSGLDVNIDYSYDFGAGGEIFFSTIISKLYERSLQNDEVSPVVETVGTLAFPEWRGNLNVRYNYKSLSVGLTQSYIGPQMTDLEHTLEEYEKIDTGHTWYTNMNVAYSITDNLTASVAVTNLFNEGTPRLPGASRGGASWYSGYTNGLFDTIGRFATVNVNYTF